jgi:hypothetical protein
MLNDYSNRCTRACRLGTAAKIKIMGEPSLVFTGLWFGDVKKKWDWLILSGCMPVEEKIEKNLVGEKR